MKSDVRYLEELIQQVTELITVAGMEDGEPPITGETLLAFERMSGDESTPLHPQLIKHEAHDLTHVDIDELCRLKNRLENDLADLKQDNHGNLDPEDDLQHTITSGTGEENPEDLAETESKDDNLTAHGMELSPEQQTLVEFTSEDESPETDGTRSEDDSSERN